MPRATLTNDEMATMSTELLDIIEQKILALLPDASEEEKGDYLAARTGGLYYAVMLAFKQQQT